MRFSPVEITDGPGMPNKRGTLKNQQKTANSAHAMKFLKLKNGFKLSEELFNLKRSSSMAMQCFSDENIQPRCHDGFTMISVAPGCRCVFDEIFPARLEAERNS
jgi:hypothetical protein